MNLPLYGPLALMLLGASLFSSPTLTAAEPAEAPVASPALPDLGAIMAEAHKAMPGIKCTFKSKLTFTGCWEDPAETVTATQKGRFQGELKAGGRFKLKVDPTLSAWSGGPAKLYGEALSITFDGKKTFCLVEKMGPFDQLSTMNRGEMFIKEPFDKPQMALHDDLVSQAFIGIGHFVGLGGDWEDVAYWNKIPKDSLQFKMTDHQTLLISTVDPKAGPNDEPYEQFEFALTPKLGIKRYRNIIRDLAGKVTYSYEVNVSEFESSLPGPVMFPKKVTTDKMTTKTEFSPASQYHSEITYDYPPAPLIFEDYDIIVPDGTYVKDKILGVEYQAYPNVSELIQSMRKLTP